MSIKKKPSYSTLYTYYIYIGTIPRFIREKLDIWDNSLYYKLLDIDISYCTKAKCFTGSQVYIYVQSMVQCRSDQCTEQLISLRSLATQIAQRYISAVWYTNVNGVSLFCICIHNLYCLYKQFFILLIIHCSNGVRVGGE